jgi:hypothetical protein
LHRATGKNTQTVPHIHYFDLWWCESNKLSVNRNHSLNFEVCFFPGPAMCSVMVCCDAGEGPAALSQPWDPGEGEKQLTLQYTVWLSCDVLNAFNTLGFELRLHTC